MKILGFCEGARADTGGVGLIGVPLIHQALANAGHQDALVIGGDAMPTARRLLKSSLEGCFAETGQQLTIVSYPALGKWCFSQQLYGPAKAKAAEADFLTLHSLFSYPVLAGYSLACRFRKPYGLWPHGVLAPVQRDVSRMKKAVYRSMVATRMLESASVLFFSAEGEREEVAPLGLTAPSVVIPHGIDTGEFAYLPERGSFRRRYLAGSMAPLVLYLGRLNIKKGLDLLIDSMVAVIRAIPDVQLAIVGGSHPPEFERQVHAWLQSANLQDRVVLTGRLDDEGRRAAFADCDLFVLPSAAENFGFAMFEAMASRVPVVVSDTLNYAAAVLDAGAGLTPPRESGAFTDAITSLLRDPSKRRLMGDSGARLAAEFSWERCGERLETAIDCVLTQTPFPSSLHPWPPT